MIKTIDNTPIQVYRSWEPSEGSNIGEERFSEICRVCAKEEIEQGKYVEWDGYLSNISPDSIWPEGICQNCGGDFETEQESWDKLEGAV